MKTNNIFRLGILPFMLLTVWGCGGSDSSVEPIVSDGRSIVLRVDQNVMLGNNTRFTVRSVNDSRRPDDSAGITTPRPSVVTASLATPDSIQPVQSVEIADREEKFVTSNATGLSYRLTLDNIEPPRGLSTNQINQEDYRLTFRILKVP